MQPAKMPQERKRPAASSCSTVRGDRARAREGMPSRWRERRTGRRADVGADPVRTPARGVGSRRTPAVQMATTARSATCTSCRWRAISTDLGDPPPIMIGNFFGEPGSRGEVFALKGARAVRALGWRPSAMRQTRVDATCSRCSISPSGRACRASRCTRCWTAATRYRHARLEFMRQSHRARQGSRGGGIARRPLLRHGPRQAAAAHREMVSRHGGGRGPLRATDRSPRSRRRTTAARAMSPSRPW